MAWEPNPVRGADADVLPHDDPSAVPNEWTLLRHVHPEQWAPERKGLLSTSIDRVLLQHQGES
jgi:hypothetical protein